MINKIVLTLTFGTFIGFVSYCVAFDRKRRSDPDYKRKVRERRNKKNQPKNPFAEYNMSTRDSMEKKREFFFQQMQLGEDLLSIGKLEQAADNFVNAVIFSNQPESILSFIVSRVPPISSMVCEKFEEKMKLNAEYEKFLSDSAYAPASKEQSTNKCNIPAEPSHIDNIIIDID